VNNKYSQGRPTPPSLTDCVCYNPYAKTRVICGSLGLFGVLAGKLAERRGNENCRRGRALPSVSLSVGATPQLRDAPLLPKQVRGGPVHMVSVSGPYPE